jgi:hypothetical protein
MRRLKSGLIYTLAFILLLIFFAPKVYLYFAFEHALEKQNVRISQEKVLDSGFKLKITDGSLYYDDLNVGTFEDISVVPLLLYNHIKIENFVFSDDMSRFAKGTLQNVNVTYHTITPLTVHLEAVGDLGEVNAQIHVKDRNASIHLIPSERLLKSAPFWLKKMKKSSEGVYSYATTY